MAFESLSFRYNFQITDFPERWLPLIHLYDPDLPLFPIYYFHAISNKVAAGLRPNFTDRVFGYLEKMNVVGAKKLDIFLITNKDLFQEANSEFRNLAENEIRERLGLNNPVTAADVANTFLPPLDYANAVMNEIWHRVVSDTYDNLLPFGRLWDEVLGLTRFVASWNSDKGRKGELVQTHYFCSKFGEKIQVGGGIPNVDFFLLPTIHELLEPSNPLNTFPNYSKLVDVANRFQNNNCTYVPVGTLYLSKYNNPPNTGSFNTQKLNAIISQAYIPQNLRGHAIECFNAFYKGPTRTILFLMMLSDLRTKHLDPSLLNNSNLGCIYDQLKSTYQSPKVIHIYAQQSFGNPNAIPKDIWIDTFLKWPLNIKKHLPISNPNKYLFSKSNNLGKAERLIWVAAQARKVHSSACNDALWCIKKASNDNARGGNPLSCRICLASIRNVCPAFNEIKNKTVVFNKSATASQFQIQTSGGNNIAINQKFYSCSGKSIYDQIIDDFSTSDNPNGFAPFPSQHHNGGSLTVQEFIDTY